MNDDDGEWEGRKERTAWQRSHSQHPRRSLRDYPLEQEESFLEVEGFLEVEQDDLRHTQASMLTTATATAVSAGGNHGAGDTAVSALAT